MTYALFQDILEILENNPEAFPQVTGLAPTAALLNARFLELEVMRAKLGRARPISETELSFLGTFHLRFRKAIEEYRSSQAAAQETPAAVAAPAATQAEAPPPAQVDPPPVQPVVPPDPEPQPPTPPLDSATQAESDASTVTDGSSTDEIFVPPDDEQTPPPAENQPTAPADDEPAAPAPPPQREPAPEPEPAPAQSQEADADQPALSFEDALDAGDTQIILRELYKEVTAIAEGIWTKDIPPPAKTWEKVSVSGWYETNFSELGLRPASDFYDIIAKVDRRMREGSTKEQLQNYLKEANFAQILLALRDMFQKNHI
jgi:hypothetical protein